MKNQYVGDIGDFGKYSLLRAFSKAGVTIGVNWYLTDNDRSNDGKFTKYLHEGSLRYLEPIVFDVLQPLAEREDKTVQDISRSNLLAGAVFFDEPLRPEGNPAERKAQRAQWFEKSLEVLSGTQLVFLDPDNGLLVSDDASKLNAEKYALPSEVEAYYNEGHDVVYYCHKGRRNYSDWDDYKSFMPERLPKAKPVVLTYRKGTQRSYIFLIHEEKFIRYRRILEPFLSFWHRLYVEEYIRNVLAANEHVGEPFVISKSDGTTVTLYHRADGRIEIRNSSKQNVISVLNTDDFCRRFFQY